MAINFQGQLYFKAGVSKNLTPALALLSASESVLAIGLFFSSCQSNDNKQIVVGNDVKVEGSLDADSLKAAGGSVRAFQVSAEGIREPFAGFTLQDGNFSASIGSAFLFPKPLQSPPETFGFMGYGMTDGHSFTSGRFGEKTIGFARIEIVGEDAFKTSKPAVSYAQILVPITRRSVLSDDQPLVLEGKGGGKIKLDEQIARLRVKVINQANGSPISGALVTAIALNKKEPLLTTDNPTHGPIYQSTGSDGYADVFGIRVASGADPSTQLIVIAKGYCNFVDEPQAFFLSSKIERTVALQPCSGDDDDKPGRFRIAFDDAVHKSKIEYEGVMQERGLINEDKIKINLLTSSQVIRPLRIMVYEGAKPEGKPRTDLTLPTFSSSVDINVPVVFGAGKSLSGMFTVTVQSIFSDLDRSQFGAPPVEVLYGVKSVTRPTVNLEDVMFRSSVGVDGVISGNTGNSFSVEYKGCEDGGEMAVWLGVTAPVVDDLPFQPCFGVAVRLTPEQAGITTGLRIGGSRIAYVYYRDPFGNVNEIFQNANSGKKSVYVDFGIPNLSMQPVPFASSYGFANKSDPKGEGTQSYIFKTGLVLTPSTIQNFVLRFAGSIACQHGNPSTEDGSGSSDDKGHLIATFSSGPSAALAAANSETKCGEDRSLAAADIDFPSVVSAQANIYFRVRDLAGNVSQPILQPIPPCGGSSSVHVCWQP